MPLPEPREGCLVLIIDLMVLDEHRHTSILSVSRDPSASSGYWLARGTFRALPEI